MKKLKTKKKLKFSDLMKLGEEDCGCSLCGWVEGGVMNFTEVYWSLLNV